mgnify:FL=1
MKLEYLEMEMNIIQIDANDIITKSDCYDCRGNSRRGDDIDCDCMENDCDCDCDDDRD